MDDNALYDLIKLISFLTLDSETLFRTINFDMKLMKKFKEEYKIIFKSVYSVSKEYIVLKTSLKEIVISKLCLIDEIYLKQLNIEKNINDLWNERKGKDLSSLYNRLSFDHKVKLFDNDSCIKSKNMRRIFIEVQMEKFTKSLGNKVNVIDPDHEYLISKKFNDILNETILESEKLKNSRKLIKNNIIESFLKSDCMKTFSSEEWSTFSDMRSLANRRQILIFQEYGINKQFDDYVSKDLNLKLVTVITFTKIELNHEYYHRIINLKEDDYSLMFPKILTNELLCCNFGTSSLVIVFSKLKNLEAVDKILERHNVYFKLISRFCDFKEFLNQIIQT
jgi:hypothetical protein